MTDDEFKKHLYRQLEEDKKNAGVLTNRLYPTPRKENKNNHTLNRNRVKSK